MYKKGFKSVTVGECLRDPPENWYRAGSGKVPSSTPKSTTSTTTKPSATPTGQSKSVDGRCLLGVTCLGSHFGQCCSQYGWCGSSTAHCGVGCQPSSGVCNGSSPSSSISKPSASLTSSHATIGSATSRKRDITTSVVSHHF